MAAISAVALENKRSREAAYYLANKPRMNAQSAAYRLANRERLKAWRVAKKERINAVRAVWALANRDRLSAEKAANVAANLERTRAVGCAWRAANVEHMRAYSRAYHAAHKEHYKAQQRLYGLKKRGLNEELVRAMRDAQGDACAICIRPFPTSGKQIERPHVDHDHLTGRVRGLLCGKCNLGISYFSDSIDSLSRAITYLDHEATQ